MFHDLKSLLGGALKRNNIERQVTTAQVIDALNESLLKILPTSRPNDARAISVHDRVATVACLNAAASQLVTENASMLRNMVTQQLPTCDLRGVRTRIVASYPSAHVVE